MIDFILILLV